MNAEAVGASMSVAGTSSHRTVLLGAAAVAVLLLGVYLIASGLEGEDHGTPFEPIAEAAQRTADFPGARVTLSGRMESEALPVPVTMKGSGAFNGQTQRARMTLLTRGPDQSFPTVVVSDGVAVYMQSPAFGPALPGGKTWMKVEVGSAELLQAQATGSGDPRQQLDALRAVSGDVETVGTERVGDAETTHYRASIDYGLYVEQLRDQGLDEAAEQVEATADLVGESVPVEIWIDQGGRVRRYVQSLAFGALAGGDAELTVQMEFSDFGIEPEIAIPPTRDVYDASELGREYLESLESG